MVSIALRLPRPPSCEAGRPAIVHPAAARPARPGLGPLRTVPIVCLHRRDDLKAAPSATGSDDHRLALGNRHSGGGVDGGLVRDEDGIAPAARWQREQPAQPTSLTLGGVAEEVGRKQGARRSGTTKREAGSITGSAEGTRKHQAHRDLEAPERAADDARLAPPTGVQVALTRTVAQVTCHVRRRPVGGRVAEGHHVAADAAAGPPVARNDGLPGRRLQVVARRNPHCPSRDRSPRRP